jgi:hypothetical protein
MIRFVDLTSSYWVDGDGPPCCAFLNTVSDTFIALADGTHVFDNLGDVRKILGERGVALVPDGFFTAKDT